MAVTIAYFLILIALSVPAPVIAQNKPVPKTPSEAYVRATEPLRQWSKSKNQTLETNIQANKEQERLARQYVSLFKVEGWKGKQLFDLGQLYFVALLPEGTERVFTAYLRDPAATEVTHARRNLLWAYVGQKKWDEAMPIAEQLLNDPKYNWDVNTYIQFLIEGLRAADEAKAIALSEKRLPKLLQLGQSRILELPLNREGEPLVLFGRAAKDEKGGCKVHHHPLTVAVVPIAYGLLPGLGKEYYAAELRDFPNAMTRYEGGCVVMGAKEAKVLQCQKCLAAKKAWMEGQDRK